MKCKACGAEIADGSLFCTECGAKVEQPIVDAEATQLFGQAPVPETVAAAATVSTVNTVNTVNTVSNMNPTPVATVSSPEQTKISKVVSTGAFFWLEVLYALPMVGFIAAIVFAAASENDNIKHHALAKIIVHLVALALSIISIIICVSAISKAGLSIDDLKNIYNYYY